MHLHEKNTSYYVGLTFIIENLGIRVFSAINCIFGVGTSPQDELK